MSGIGGMERGMEGKEVEEGEGDGCSMCRIAYQHKLILPSPFSLAHPCGEVGITFN